MRWTAPSGQGFDDTDEVTGFRFTYVLGNHGWAVATVESEGRTAPMDVSYLSDALRDLLDAIWGLTEGAVETTAVLHDEPPEYRWTFRRTEGDVSMEIRELDGRRSTGHVVFTASTTLLDLAGQVSAEASRILDEHGTDGYLARWKADPFPKQSHERLARWVEAHS